MQAYISCPLGVDLRKLHDVAHKLRTLGYSPISYERGTIYSDINLKGAEMFVLMSENNKFDYSRFAMTPGCKKELELAESLHKPLYLAYWKNGKELNIYPLVMKYLEYGRVLGQSGCYLQPYKAEQIINTYQIY